LNLKPYNTYLLHHYVWSGTLLSTLNIIVGREARVRLEKPLDIILAMGSHRQQRSGSESMGFSVLRDVVKVILYPFDVEKITNVELCNRLGGTQPSPNIGGLVVANNHLQWNIFHILIEECTIEAHLWRPPILSSFCNRAKSSCIK
jgi:hypothetical protein